ncbi:MAG: carbohydrate ABC transporter permease [Paracoccaceae bacterium]
MAVNGGIERSMARLAGRLVAPSWYLILAVFALPILGALWLSFRNETLGAFAAPKFIGLDNYAGALADPRFWESIRTTIWLTMLGLLVQMPIGIGLAVILDRNLRGTQVFRTILIIPMLLTPVAVGLMWRFMFDTDLGVINWALAGMGLDGPNWLGARWPAIWAVVIVDSWQSIPFIMLIVLAGLAGLPKGPREAAEIDGARAWQVFAHVTLPALGPVILVTLMIRIIDSLKMFDIIFIVTTRGGPGTATQTLGMLIYNTGFGFFQTSRAAALGILMVLMVLPVYWLWRRAAERV